MFLVVALACDRPLPPVIRSPPEDPVPSVPVPAPEPAPPVPVGIPDHLALPYATVGEDVGTAILVVESEDPPLVEVTAGPFAVGSDLVVRYTGPVDAPIIAVGTARVTVGDLVADVALAAVLGDPALPSADWTTDDWGTSATAPFPSAPFPDGDASVRVFVPSAFTDQGDIGVVTHLHGFYAELGRTLADQRWLELHTMSGRDGIFVAPQGPLNQPSGDFGQLEDTGGHARLIRDVVSVLYRDGLVERPVLGAQLVSSHSGGYAATASLIEDGGLPLSAVFLYDSVYGSASTFEGYAVGGGVLFSSYTSGGGTDGQNLALRSDLEADGLDVSHDFRPDHLRTAPAAIGFSASPHDDVMTDGLTHARWLVASPLRRSPLAAPELLSVVPRAVTWREDRVPAGLVTVVEGSDDGVTWAELGRSTSSELAVEPRAWIRLVGEDPRFGRGVPGDVYAGDGGDWLIVDGFHRVFGGSWDRPTHDFVARLGVALGGGSSAVDDAVSEGLVDLGDWDRVLWLLGDESTADQTFDADARDAIAAYVAGGGELVVSGSELGYATDPAWLSAVLGVTFVADDADATSAGGWTFGAVYPEDYPDVLSADETIWAYPSGGGAAVGSGRVVAVGFALETLADDDLAGAVAELVGWLTGG